MPTISPPAPVGVTVAGAPAGAVVVSGRRVPAPEVLATDVAGAPEGREPFIYQMPAPAATVVINHDLGYDPVSIQVFVDDVLCDEYGVTFTVPGAQVMLGFDVSVAALIRLA